jgi:hypothetical protein
MTGSATPIVTVIGAISAAYRPASSAAVAFVGHRTVPVHAVTADVVALAICSAVCRHVP